MAKEEAGVQPSNNHYWDPATEDRHVHDDGDDGDIYIMTECLYVSNEKVTTSWIVGDDDIYIMTECLSVSE